MRAVSHGVAFCAVALVLFVTLVPAHAETDSTLVIPLPVPADLAIARNQPAFGPTSVPLAPGQQKLTTALLTNYVARQQELRSVNINADMQGELTTDLLLGYIARSNPANGNSAVSALASFAAAEPVAVEPALNPSFLSAYIADGYEPLAQRMERANTERDCLAQAIYHEARGESQAGQMAVANVIVNRARSGKFPSTLCGVIYQNADKGYHRCQFTFACDGRTDTPRERRAWAHSAELAQQVYAEFATGEAVGAIPGTALYYHTTAVSPSWSRTYDQVAQIGSHIFYAP